MHVHAGTIIAFWSMLDLLALVTTFGVGTALAMIFRRWWFSTAVFGLFSVYMFIALAPHMTLAEWILYSVGLVGVILSTFAVRALKKNGYPLFSGM